MKELRMHKMRSWKAGMEWKGLRLNMQKTKVMISGANLYTLKDSAGEQPWESVAILFSVPAAHIGSTRNTAVSVGG